MMSSSFLVRRGVSLVELLVVLAITGIILGVVGAYFGFQTRITRDTQARNELNVRARSVLEAITQDVKSAGARAVVDASGRAVFQRDLDCDMANDCLLVMRAGGEGAVQSLEMEYISSLFLSGAIAAGPDPVVPDEACRRVVYTLVGGVLHRSDVQCADDSDLTLGFATELADNVTNIGISFVCGPGAGGTVLLASACFFDGSDEIEDGFVREARISVSAVSPRPQAFELVLDTATTTPNLRSAVRFDEGGP